MIIQRNIFRVRLHEAPHIGGTRENVPKCGNSQLLVALGYPHLDSHVDGASSNQLGRRGGGSRGGDWEGEGRAIAERVQFPFEYESNAVRNIYLVVVVCLPSVFLPVCLAGEYCWGAHRVPALRKHMLQKSLPYRHVGHARVRSGATSWRRKLRKREQLLKKKTYFRKLLGE